MKKMLNAIKKEVFERLGKARAELVQTSRNLKANGFEELAEFTRWEIHGIETAIESLGFDVVEFHEYYKANRSRFREELKSK